LQACIFTGVVAVELVEAVVPVALLEVTGDPTRVTTAAAEVDVEVSVPVPLRMAVAFACVAEELPVRVTWFVKERYVPVGAAIDGLVMIETTVVPIVVSWA